MRLKQKNNKCVICDNHLSGVFYKFYTQDGVYKICRHCYLKMTEEEINEIYNKHALDILFKGLKKENLNN